MPLRRIAGDGKLEICVASHSSKLRLIPMLIRSRLPRFVKRKGVRVYECREARIHMDRPAPIHTDGEICPLPERSGDSVY